MTTDFLRWYEESLANDPILIKKKQAEAGQYDQVGTDPAWLGEIQAQALGKQAALKERNRYVGETVAGFNKAASSWQDEIDKADEDIAKAQAKLDELGPSLPGEEDIVNPKVEAYRAKLNEALNRKRTFANAIENQRKTWMFGQDARPNLNVDSSPLADTRDWLNTPTVKTSGRLEFPAPEPPKTPGPVIVNVTDQKVYDAQAKLAAKQEDVLAGLSNVSEAISWLNPQAKLIGKYALPALGRPSQETSAALWEQSQAAARNRAIIQGRVQPTQADIQPGAQVIPALGRAWQGAAEAAIAQPSPFDLSERAKAYQAMREKQSVGEGVGAVFTEAVTDPLNLLPGGFIDSAYLNAFKMAQQAIKGVRVLSKAEKTAAVARAIELNQRELFDQLRKLGAQQANDAVANTVIDAVAASMDVNPTDLRKLTRQGAEGIYPTTTQIATGQSAAEVAQQSAKRQAMREAAGPTILERTTKDAGTITPPANSQIVLGQDGKLAGFKMADGSFMPYRAAEQAPPLSATKPPTPTPVVNPVVNVTPPVTPTPIVKQEPPVMQNVGISQEVPTPKPAISPAVETKASGETIAESLGVKFDGVQKSPDGDYLQYTDPQTGSSFYGNNAEEAKAALDELRGRFKKAETPPTTTPASVKGVGVGLTQEPSIGRTGVYVDQAGNDVRVQSNPNGNGYVLETIVNGNRKQLPTVWETWEDAAKRGPSELKAEVDLEKTRLQMEGEKYAKEVYAKPVEQAPIKTVIPEPPVDPYVDSQTLIKEKLNSYYAKKKGIAAPPIEKMTPAAVTDALGQGNLQADYLPIPENRIVFDKFGVAGRGVDTVSLDQRPVLKYGPYDTGKFADGYLAMFDHPNVDKFIAKNKESNIKYEVSQLVKNNMPVDEAKALVEKQYTEAAATHKKPFTQMIDGVMKKYTNATVKEAKPVLFGHTSNKPYIILSDGTNAKAIDANKYRFIESIFPDGEAKYHIIPGTDNAFVVKYRGRKVAVVMPVNIPIPDRLVGKATKPIVTGEQTTTGQLRNTMQQTGEAGFMGRRPTQPPAAIPTSPTGQRALDRDIDIVADQVEKAKPGQFSTGLYLNIPGMKRVVDAFRPGIGLYHEAKNVLKAAMTGQMSYNNITREAFPKFFDSLKELDTAFGKGAVGDKVLSVNFTGTRPTQGIDVVGKLADIVERPQMYDLTPAQRQAVDNYNAFNEWMRQWTNENYGIDVSKYEMPGGGGYLPHINKNADITDFFDVAPSSQMSAGTKTKQRVWDTIADRAANAPEGASWNAAKNQWEDAAGNRIKGTFEPETNFQKLAGDSIRFKANLASRRAFDNVAGGLTRLDVLEKQNPTLFRKYQAAIRRVDSLKGSLGRIDDKLVTAIDDFKASPMDPDDIQNLVDNIDPTIGRGQRAGMGKRDLEQELTGAKAQLAAVRKNIMATSPRDYKAVPEAGRRYFKAPEALAIQRIKQRPTGWAKTALNIMENIRATAFSGDLSPITGIQAPMQFLADPVSSLVAGEKFIRQAVKDKSLWKQFSADGVARLLKNDPVYGEYLRSIGISPNVTPQEFMTGYLGRIPKMNQLTEGTYNVVNQMGYEAWKNNTRRLMKNGMSELEAKSVASYMSQLTSPRVNYTALGMSPAQAQLFRALPTSYSFIRQPAVMQGNAMKYILKMASGQKVAKVTAIEKESFRTMATLASMMAGIAATSAALSAAAQNKDIGEAMFEAVNPDPRNGKFMSLVVGDHRIPIGGPHRAFFRAMFPQDEVDIFGQKGKLPFSMPFAGMPAYLKNRLSPLLSTQLDLVQNKDYYSKQIMKGEDFFPKMLQALEYEIESMLPLAVGTIAEGLRTGQDKGKIAENVASQFAGVNVMDITPQSELRQKWQKEIDAYYKLPSDTAVARSQKTRTKEESRRASADLDARLFTIGTVDSVLTPQAMQLAYKYITDNNIDPETIPGIKATMTRHARLRELGQPVEVNTPTERLAYALSKKK